MTPYPNTKRDVMLSFSLGTAFIIDKSLLARIDQSVCTNQTPIEDKEGKKALFE
jgi:hypothetical protein